MKLKMGVALQMEREPRVSVRTNSTGAPTPVRVTTEQEAEGPPQTLLEWKRQMELEGPGGGRWSLFPQVTEDGVVGNGF